MRQLRAKNDNCINCGGEVPLTVEQSHVDDLYEFRCPECNDVLAQGVVSTNGEPATSPRSPPSPNPAREIAIREDVEWKCWEVWWTNRTTVSMIHGRIIDGTKDLGDFVEKLYDIYDRS